MNKVLGILCVLCAILIVACAQPQTDDSITQQSLQLKNGSDNFRILYFFGDGCPICAQMKPFLDELEENYDVEILRFEVYHNRENQNLFGEVSQKYGTSPRGVPMTFIGDQYWVGFQSSTAAQIEAMVQRCEARGNCLDKFQQE